MGETGAFLRSQLMDAIDVWQIDLDDASVPVDQLDNVLSASERERAARFKFRRDAFRFKYGRAMLRLGLGAYLDITPQKIELAASSYGKPYLPDVSGLHFNVTHCRGQALIAFTAVGEIGIDIEARDRTVEALDIANAHFCKREQEAIAAAPDGEAQAMIFLRFWTRKEAVLKAAGCGLQRGLGNLDVSDNPALVSYLGEIEPNNPTLWRLQDLEGTVGHMAAVAASPGDWVVRQRKMQFGSFSHSVASFE